MLLWFGLCRPSFPRAPLWQPFTYLFLHDPTDFLHVLFICSCFWMSGRELELVWGKPRFGPLLLPDWRGEGLIEVLVKAVPTFFWSRSFRLTHYRRVRGDFWNLLRPVRFSSRIGR